MSSEFQRVAWLREFLERRGRAAAAIGPGDDAAAWTPPPGHAVVMSVDCQVEGVHFRRQWLQPASIGRRALEAAVSDLAAMAAQPVAALVALTLPADFTDAAFRDLFAGVATAAESHGMAILGGNLSGGALAVTTTVVGHGPPGDLARRSGACAGDDIWVTGCPGRSRVGLAVLESGGAPAAGPQRACVEAYRHPRARVREALEIRRRAAPHALIDVSDGVALDLAHVLSESRRAGAAAGHREPLAGVLDEAAVLDAIEDPGSPAAARTYGACARAIGIDPLHAILTGGEDFELLLTAPPAAAGELQRCAADCGLPIRRLGAVVAGRQGVFLRHSDGAEEPVTDGGFDHFSRRP